MPEKLKIKRSSFAITFFSVKLITLPLITFQICFASVSMFVSDAHACFNEGFLLFSLF